MDQKTVFRSYLVKEPDIMFNQETMTSSSAVADFMRNFWLKGTIGVNEHFYVLHLNNNLGTVSVQLVGSGGITATLVDLRLVAKGALDSLATRVILCHNHPSGKLEPSESDYILTSKIEKALQLFDIRVDDHIILTETDYYSFADNGKI
jgi:DNA repair protein RadC